MDERPRRGKERSSGERDGERVLERNEERDRAEGDGESKGAEG